MLLQLSLMRALLAGLLAALLAAPTLVPSTSAAAPADRGDPGGGPVVVRGWVTTADLRRTFDRLPDRELAASDVPASAEEIVVDGGSRGQAITAGFGVAMTDSSAWLLRNRLDRRARSAVMRRLFSPTAGIGLSFLRVPIGGSDYIVGGHPYTYDDLPAGRTDPGLAHFSVGHDVPYVFPMIRRALALNDELTVMANPWTPPAWMKLDGRLVSTTALGTLKPGLYRTYAHYLVRSVRAFGRHGVPVTYLGVQNEPYTALIGAVAQIPSAFLSPADEGRLIADHLAPALRAAGLDPLVLGYDDGFQRSETYIPVLMATAAGQVDGFAYHCYLSDPSSMQVEGALFPGKEQLETECSSNLSNVEPAEMMIRNLRNGASGVQLWNAALDEAGGPKIGQGCVGLPGTGPHAGEDCIAPVTVDTRTGRYSLTSDYWALAHFSRYIRRGAVRLDSTSATCRTSPLPSATTCGVETVAFENLDGSRVLVATAHDGRSHDIAVEQDGAWFEARVPDGGTVTFVWAAS